MHERLREIFDDLLRNWRCRLVEFGGEADHVHLLIDAHPSMNLSQMIGNLKTVSARRVRQEFPDQLKPYFWKPYFWSKSYAIISVGGRASLETLVEYIRNQESP